MRNFTALRTGAALALLSIVLPNAGCGSPGRVEEASAPPRTSEVVSALSSMSLLSASARWPTAAPPPESLKARPNDYVPIAQEQPSLGGDLPHFTVFRPASSGPFWVRKTEGPAGAATWYGPLRLNPQGKVVAAE